MTDEKPETAPEAEAETNPPEVESEQSQLADENGERLSDSTMVVRYTGTSNTRMLSAADLAGSNETGGESRLLIWGPEGEIPWESWLNLAGSDERAREMLKRHAHEFVVAGPGAEDYQAEEFNVGGEAE